jgi:hypothetical protein
MPFFIQLFESKAFMTLEWRSESATPLSVDAIFQIEQAAASYFSDLLADTTHSALQDNTVIHTDVAARKQNVAVDNVVLETEIAVISMGDTGILDLAELLQYLTRKNTTNSSFTNLDFLIGMDIKLSIVSFNFAIGSELLSQIEPESQVAEEKYSDNEKVLIIVASVLSFALFILSVILIWIAGGWLALRKQVKVLIHREEEMTRMTKQQDIEAQPTQETDEEVGSPREDATNFTNPSGILGVNPYYGRSASRLNALDGLGIKMTPARRGNSEESDIFTPMSEATHYTDSGRAPMGITSMRKLIPEGEDGDRSSLGTFGIKRLEF